MEVRELPAGELAPDKSDRVKINVLPNGKAGFSSEFRQGSVTVHSTHANEFSSEAIALEAALAHARERGVALLYVERAHA